VIFSDIYIDGLSSGGLIQIVLWSCAIVSAIRADSNWYFIFLF